jgi:hypothetical protein
MMVWFTQKIQPTNPTFLAMFPEASVFFRPFEDILCQVMALWIVDE